MSARIGCPHPNPPPRGRGLLLTLALFSSICLLLACQPNPADERAAAEALARGDAALSAQQWQAAIAAYGEAIRRKPTLAAAYLGRSAAAFAGGDLDQAERDCTRVIALHPRTPNDVPALTSRQEAEAYE